MARVKNRCISLLLTFAMLLTFCPVQAFAADTDGPAIYIEDMAADITETKIIAVPVKIRNNPGICSGNFSTSIPDGWKVSRIANKTNSEYSIFMKYDTIIEGWDYIEGTGLTPNTDQGIAVFAGSKNTTEKNGVLYWVYYTVPENTMNGEYTITPVSDDITSIDADNTAQQVSDSFTFEAGTITITGGQDAPDELTDTNTQIRGIDDTYEFIGSAITPEPTVTYTDGTEEVVLTRDTNYTLSYANNTNVGEATITITGTGKYTGTVIKTFQIVNRKATINVEDTFTKTFTQNEIDKTFNLNATVNSGGKLSYEVTEGNNVVSVSEDGTVTILKAGEAKIKISAEASEGYDATDKTVIVTVNKAPATLNVGTPIEKTFGDDAFDLQVTKSGDGALHFEVTNGSGVVSVDQNGHVIITNAGTAVITVTSEETVNYAAGTASVNITVKSAELEATDAEMTVPTSVSQLPLAGVVTATAKNNEPVTYTYNVTSGDNLIEVFKSNGAYFVRAKGTTEGDAEIEVTMTAKGHNSKTAKITVRVSGRLPIPADQITFMPKKASDTYKGDTWQLSEFVDAATCSMSELAGVSPTYQLNGQSCVLTDTIQNAGTYTITATFTNDMYQGSASLKFTIEKAEITGATVSPATYEYTGSQIKPEKSAVTVTAGTLTLNPDDYTVQYGENISAATGGSVTATAAEESNFTGNATANFSITPKDISGATVTLDKDSWEYTGSEIKPAVKAVAISGFDAALVAGADYDVTYKDNVAVGTATVTVNGKGNYTGSVSTTFSIVNRKATINVEDTFTKTFTQNEIDKTFNLNATVNSGGELSYEVTEGNDVVSVSADGTVTILKAGEAKIKISAEASEGYDATDKTVIVTVNKAPATLNVETPIEKTFGDDAFDLQVTKSGDGALHFEVTNGSGVVSVDQNGHVIITNAGTAVITVTSAETVNYAAGSASVNITVNRAELEAADAEMIVPTSASQLPLAGVVTATAKNNEPVTYTYNVTSGDNLIEVFDSNGAYFVKAKGTTEGDAEIEVMMTANGHNSKTAKITVRVSGRLPIPADKIIFTTKKESDTYKGDTWQLSEFVNAATCSMSELAGVSPSYQLNGQPCVLTDTIQDAGTYTITATFTNDMYQGFATQTVTIKKAEITGATVSPEAHEYTGSQIRPEKPDITVTAGTLTLNPDDYTVQYGENISVATGGSVTVTAAEESNFTGNATANFSITPKDISGATVTLDKDSWEYTGSEIKPAVKSVAISGFDAALVAGVDYDVSYTNNIAAGTATATATGKGNYTGTASLGWTINPAEYTVTVPNIMSVKQAVDTMPDLSFVTAVGVNSEVLEGDLAFTKDGAALTDEMIKALAVGEHTVDWIYTLNDSDINKNYVSTPNTGTITLNVTEGDPQNILFTGISAPIYGVDAFKMAYKLTTTGGEAITDDVALTWESSDPSVATVAEDGTITVVGPGTTVITVVATETGSYSAGKQIYTMTIAKKEVTVSGITAADRVYDGTTAAALNLEDAKIDTPAPGDTLGVTATGMFADANAGSGKIVTISGLALTGEKAENYELSNDSQTTTTANITKNNNPTLTLGNLNQQVGSVTPVTTALSPADKTAEITITYGDPGSTTLPTAAGSYIVTASFAGNNNIAAVQQTGTLTITEKRPPSDDDNSGSDDNSGNNSGSHSGSHSGGGPSPVSPKDTNISVTAQISDGKADANIDKTTADKMVTDAVKNKSENVNVKVTVPADAASVTTTLPCSSAKDLADKTESALNVETPLATVFIPNDAVGELAKKGKNTVGVTVEKSGDDVKVTIQADGEDIDTLSGMKTSIPMDKTESALNVETPLATVFIPNDAVGELAKKGKNTVSITVEKSGDDVKVTIQADGEDIGMLSGVKASIPTDKTGSGNVAAIVNPDGTETIIKKSMVKDGKIVVPIGGSATVRIADRSKSFDDINGHWADDSIGFVTSRGLFEGVSEKEFAPDAQMTRAMLVTVLHRLEDKPESVGNKFTDVPDDTWYTDAVAWAAANGIVNGKSDTSFAPDDSITREQLAAILYRYAKGLGLDTSASGNISSFSDANAVSTYATDAIRWAVGNGIINGKTSTTIEPQGDATRAEVSTMLMRLVGVINDESTGEAEAHA